MSLPATDDPGVAVGRLDDLVRARVELVLDLVGLELASHEALDGVDGVLRVGDGLPLGDLPDEALAARGERRRRGRRARTFGVRDDLDVDLARRALLDDRDAGVRRAEVDADDLAIASAPSNQASGSVPSAGSLPPSVEGFGLRDDDHRGANEPVALKVSGLDLGDHGSRGVLVGLDLLDRLVEARDRTACRRSGPS